MLMLVSDPPTRSQRRYSAMGAVLGLPVLGSLAGLSASAASAIIGGLAFFCTGQAVRDAAPPEAVVGCLSYPVTHIGAIPFAQASALTKSCNCNSSVATRVGFSIIFLLNSLLAWLMLSDWAIRAVAKWSYEYIKMSCTEGRCYGVLAVSLFILSCQLLFVFLSVPTDKALPTERLRAMILVNGRVLMPSLVFYSWWGPKVAAWIILVVISFFTPNGFFMFYGNYISLIGATIFILIGLVLLVDFAHSWSEACLERWESTDSPFWKWTLIASTLGLYVVALALTAIQYAFFAGKGCGLNQFLIMLNLLVSLAVSWLSIAPAIQEANPRSGLAQSGMVVAYTAYLVTSAIANHDDASTKGQCNPLTSRAAGARTGMVVLGAIFTFLAIAYLTSRAATQSKALVGKGAKRSVSDGGYGALSSEEGELATVVSSQPNRKDSLRYQALQAAVAEGSLPASVLEEDNEVVDALATDELDDEKAGTRYNYVWFHVIFIMASMYVAMLLTNWNIVTPASSVPDQGGDATPVKIGRSGRAMWCRIVSSWVCLVLYAWSLLAPVLMPDRFEE
ncbi:BQ2448_7575 [Microbotryum intermedium]|uniref:BQ2448_7575 protein n=1 Tax=Microbotryum intermedium TaxID=269621 RepID=A0A238FTZ3_9BASI|nr:BQ2448_7575 [Microbotryum intermedium]